MVHSLESPSSPRVERKREARRREIMAAALGLVESGGLDGLTVKLLADELDYAVGALYRYFPSKSALVGELQRHVVGLLDELHQDQREHWRRLAGRGAPPPPGSAPLVPLAATAALYLHYAAASPGAFGLLALSLANPRRLIEDERAEAVIDAAQPIFERIAGDLEAAADAGALQPGPALDRAVVLWASLHGVAQLHKLTGLRPERIDDARLTRGLLEALLVGWGAAPERVREAIDWVTHRDVARVR
jgi:AcrR family transcriptional regulator